MCKTKLLVSDTILLVSRKVDRSIPKTQGIHQITRKHESSGHDGKVTVRTVSEKEMERLWK